MSQQNQFVLVSIMDNALMGHWSFRAADELAVARHLLRDPWQYQDVFWALRISVQDVQRLSPADLLQEIHGSYPNSHVRAVLHLLRIAQTADCGQDEALGAASAFALHRRRAVSAGPGA